MGKVIPAGVPFAQIPHDLIRDKNVDPYAVRVYAELMARANSESRSWPSQRRVAKDLGMSRTKVMGALNSLEAEGWILITASPETTGHKQRHSYTIFGLRPQRLFEMEPDHATHRLATQAGTPGVRSGTPDGPVPDHDVVPNKNQQLEPEPDPGLAAKPQRPPDPVWDSFIAVHGNPEDGTERGKFNRAVKLLKDAKVTPEEYPMLVAAYSMKYDDLQPAPMTVPVRIGEMRHFMNRGPINVPDRETLNRHRRVEAAQAEYDDDQKREAIG
ncbi:MAG: hypothetical protein DRQ39_08255 [Gammaproteobacteria bacterium]|nr:MAG: hypothetical protein DRQ39_08255 [Gammaproteobacteria bacterium]